MSMSLLEVAVPVLAVLLLTVVVLQVRKKNAGVTQVTVRKESVSSATENKVVVKCMFGSQTGTAEGFAKEIAKEMQKHGFAAKVVDLEDVDVEDFLESGETEYHIYCMATYGEGDPTDNALQFMNFVRKEPAQGGPDHGRAAKCFFTVFALGNTQYENYNNIGKTVFSRLEALGGTALHPLGLGDDDKDIEEDFNNWREGLAQAFAQPAFGSDSAGDGGDASDTLDTLFVASFTPEPEAAELREQHGRIASNQMALARDSDLSCRHLFQGKRCAIVDKRELRQDNLNGTGSTVHVEFDLAGTGLHYSTADNLSVLCENDASQVASVARVLGLDLNQWFRLDVADPAQQDLVKPIFPSPCTIRAALAYFTDLNGAPSRSLVGKLASFSQDADHKSVLRAWASASGKEDFKRRVSDPQLSIAELFELFPGCWHITESNLGSFLELMPRLKARDYTIASSSAVQPERIALTVGVIREHKPSLPGSKERLLHGVCSTFLSRLHVGGSALVFVKESSFKLPADAKTPIIMVGPGTGIAPMRAFIQERTHQLRCFGRAKTGEAILFFGCRKEREDFLYKEELLRAVELGSLSKLHVAFSREKEQKVYVQHLIAEQAQELWSLLEKGAYVYVCGATKMGKDVHLAFVDLCKRQGGLGTVEQAKAYVSDLQTKGRYVQELWSS